jgi:Sec-independent protein translocase protein TatA
MFEISFAEVLMVAICLIFIPPELSKNVLRKIIHSYKSFKNELTGFTKEIKTYIDSEEDIAFKDHDTKTKKTNEDESCDKIMQEAGLELKTSDKTIDIK